MKSLFNNKEIKQNIGQKEKKHTRANAMLDQYL